MKRTIRKGVFETNSSSTHSLTILPQEEYDKWKNGKVFLGEDDKLYTREQAIEDLKSRSWYSSRDFNDKEVVEDLLSDNFKTYENYGYDHEQFEESYTTKSGDTIVAFGYYGYDG